MIKNIIFNRDFFYIKKAIKTAQTIATILFKLNLWPSSASNKIIVAMCKNIPITNEFTL